MSAVPVGFDVNETVYYVAGNHAWDNGNLRVVYGSSGIVTRPTIRPGYVSVKFPYNESDVVLNVVELSKTPPAPLPGGFEVGETVYFVHAGRSFDNGDSLIYGSSGVVTGAREGRLSVDFPHNDCSAALPVEWLSKTPPGPLPGGFEVGDSVYFLGAGATFEDGDALIHGSTGVVTGAVGVAGAVVVDFPQNKKGTTLPIQVLSKTPRGPLPGGFEVGETVYFVGAREDFGNGDCSLFGTTGAVTGMWTGSEEGRLFVQFPHNKHSVCHTLEKLSKTAAGPLPGGFEVDETVYYTGTGESFEDGTLVVSGSSGIVTGPCTKKKGQLVVKFSHKKGTVALPAETLSKASDGAAS